MVLDMMKTGARIMLGTGQTRPLPVWEGASEEREAKFVKWSDHTGLGSTNELEAFNWNAKGYAF